MRNNTILQFAIYTGIFVFIFLFISYFFTEISLARPGGGSGFSGGGGGGGGFSGGGGSSFSGGGSGGGGGGGLLGLFIAPIIFAVAVLSNIYSSKKGKVGRIILNAILFVVFTIIELFMLGLFFTGVTIFIVVVYAIIRIAIGKKKRSANRSYKSMPSFTYRTKSLQKIDQEIETLKFRDENYSKVLFLDFVASLFHKYYHWQGTEQLNSLLPYMPSQVIVKAKQNSNQRFSEIVIGSMEIKDIYLEGQKDKIIVELEVNYTMTRTDINKSFRYISSVRWLVSRDQTLQSKEPKHFDELECPNCAAPANFTDAGQCKHCSTFIEAGKMQWAVEKMFILKTSFHSSPNLVYYAPERGTNLPTVMQPNINSHMSKFIAEHSYSSTTDFWNEFTKEIVEPIFIAIYEAWEKQKWMDVRHVTSDRLWESNNFWIESYKEQGLINRLKELKISNITLARVDLDKFYESITVRIFASCFDYVEDLNGRIKGGNSKSSRKFSEYWTFIRKKGIEKNKIDLNHCPNCGASKENMGQAGVCNYCGTKVTSGDFSWILAIITQDEVYKG